ncbi:MAG: PQQ-dependent sugar dehydrogenase, partial [Petrimonas sp.]|nr:PQQ-dependent sugar dehydrogenase [Petrimonas sp.]
MKHFKFAAIISLAWFFASASCVEQKDSDGGDIDQTPTEQEPQAGTLPPVETGKANTNYKPAFEGQTRIAGVKTTTPYEAKVIASGLASPWAVTALPDGRLAITEKGGTMRIATTEGTVSPPISGFPAVDDRGQGGLLDVAPAPDFEASRMLYFTLAEKTTQ